MVKLENARNKRLRRTLGAGLLALLAGCSGAKAPNLQTPVAPAPSANLGTLRGSIQQASVKNSESAARVNHVGRQLIIANPELKFRPNFMVKGDPGFGLSHRGETMIDISEGLVDRCTSDEQLAGLLALEMAKIIAERESRDEAMLASLDREPPMETPIGAGNGGYGDPNPIRLGELKKEGFVKRRTGSGKVSDAHLLAGQILRRAGYPDSAAADAGMILLDAKKGQ